MNTHPSSDWLHVGYISMAKFAVSLMGPAGFEPATKGL